MNHYYFDCNPLVSWVVARANKPDARDLKVATRVDDILADKNNRVAISELSLAEFQNQICILERGDGRRFTRKWADESLDSILDQLVTGRIEVLQTPPKLIEDVMATIRWVTRESGRNFRAWDAAHLRYSCLWAKTLGVKVNLVTSDKDFEKLWPVYTEYCNYVVLLDPAS